MQGKGVYSEHSLFKGPRAGSWGAEQLEGRCRGRGEG